MIYYIFFFIILLLVLNQYSEFYENSTPKNPKIPKIIWSYWDQGIKSSPLIVKKCFKNWKKYNPDWDINILNDSNINQYINTYHIDTINKENSSVQKKSDMIRFLLLIKYGGVWLDSSIILTESLEWIQNINRIHNSEVIIFEADHLLQDLIFQY